MSSLYDFKPRFQAALRPTADRLAATGVRPNHVTLAALGLALVSGIAVALFPDARPPLVLLALALLTRMALNAIDGMLAREHDMATPGGALLNELADVASDLVMYLPLLLVPEFSPLLLSLTIILAVLTEVAGLAALGIGADRRHDGPLGKSDRAAAFGLLALLTGFGIMPAVAVNLCLALMIGLGFLTVMNRVNGALEERAARAEVGAGAEPAKTDPTPKP